MPPLNPPSDPVAQLQWLTDRAAISDMLTDFARALDEHDWDGYAGNYAPEGTLCFGEHVAHEGREGLAEFVADGPGRYAATHHVGTNESITIDGDLATARSYIVAGHLFGDNEPGRHFEGWGIYTRNLRRTEEGWRFTRVALDIKYATGQPPQRN